MQRNWIGKSQGAEITFEIQNSPLPLTVYTTRPDTIFGVDFMVVAPEHELVNQITTPEQKAEIEKYLDYVQSRSERERLAEVKQITGCFTGAYALNPFNGTPIPIWISEYVLAGYGTGAIMAVPCGDQRDFLFARHFNIHITNIIGDAYNGQEANATKDAVLQNSDFLNGMQMKDAMDLVARKVEEMGIGKRQINYKMRDAGFSRQRYWGEPFPIVYKNDMAYAADEKDLPVELPHVENYKPGEEGEGPLANVNDWVNIAPGVRRETNTMPGYAGSSWYFLRYMDPHNDQVFADRKVTDYWNQVDVYVGGTEHAVGHLLYSRLWTKVLCDLGYISFDEPYKKIINQGMIGGSSRLVYRVRGTNTFVSLGLKGQYETDELHVDVNMVDGTELDTAAFRQWRVEYKDAEFILEDGKYICGTLLEKMSKRSYNTVDPSDIVEKYGADTFRMYEMFLGPVEQSKPWETKGIEGVHRFLKKLWRLYADEQKGLIVKDAPATPEELKVLHKTIQKIDNDTSNFSYNTAVSQFMICVNELASLKCNKRSILEPLLILLTPFAPHVSEELWQQLGNTSSILDAAYPVFEEQYVKESTFNYPVAINGKTRTEMGFALDADNGAIEQEVLANEVVQKWMEGKPLKKMVIVKGRMINIVV
jgi:leucyl-tRNA synthetase